MSDATRPGPPPGFLRLSAVVPLYNERDNLAPLVAELVAELDRIGSPYEILLVDDGSTDGSRELLDAMARENPAVRVLHLHPNQGQSAAYVAGFRVARGDYVVTLDGDLQNDPADLSRLLEWIPSHDMVVGIRRRRQDPWVRRASSRVANAVRSRILGDGIVDTGCSLRVFRRELVAGFIPFRGLHRFLPALAQAQGARVKQVPVHHRTRHAGSAKYGVGNRLGVGLLDLFGVWWYRRRYAGPRMSYASPPAPERAPERTPTEETT
jgi:glycosyltransferase involved in cell wall biosynthesis